MRIEDLRELGIDIKVTCPDFTQLRTGTNEPDQWHELTGSCDHEGMTIKSVTFSPRESDDD